MRSAPAPLHELYELPVAERVAHVGELDDERLMAAQARQLEARRHHDTWERLGAIEAATLVAAGRHDALAPLENARALAAAIPGARLEVFEGGHAFLLQDRRAWPAVAAFLRG